MLRNIILLAICCFALNQINVAQAVEAAVTSNRTDVLALGQSRLYIPAAQCAISINNIPTEILADAAELIHAVFFLAATIIDDAIYALAGPIINDAFTFIRTVIDAVLICLSIDSAAFCSNSLANIVRSALAFVFNRIGTIDAAIHLVFLVINLIVKTIIYPIFFDAAIIIESLFSVIRTCILGLPA